jgi:hypothetical protein
MVASGFFNEVPARDAVASLSHRRAANKCGAAILPFDSGTALGWKKTIVGSEAMARPAISTFCRAGLALQRQARRRQITEAADTRLRTRAMRDNFRLRTVSYLNTQKPAHAPPRRDVKPQAEDPRRATALT